MKTTLDDLDVQRLRLEPGDVVVLLTPLRLTEEQCTRIRDVMADVAPGHRCMVLNRGARLAVVSAGEAAQAEAAGARPI